MSLQYRSSTTQFKNLERLIDKAASAQSELLETSIVHAGFASAGLDLLLSSYLGSDRDYRARIRQLLTAALIHEIQKANYVITALDKISEHSIRAKRLALEAVEGIASAKTIVRSKVKKHMDSCNRLADNEEERLRRIQATRSVVVNMRNRWALALQDIGENSV